VVFTESGVKLHLSVRNGKSKLPYRYIDFLEIPTSTEHHQRGHRQSSNAHLFIVYLSKGNTSVKALDPKYIPAEGWLSVTHIIWGQTHPFARPVQQDVLTLDGAESLNNAELPNSSYSEITIEREGGLRTQGNRKSSQADSPLVSIITIVYNGEEFLEQTIQSVINQSYKNIEYIIVDGGSNDGTLEIVNRYAAYIDYWISEPDEGIYDALNKGISLANGNLIGAIHANDFYAAGAVASMVDTANRLPEKSFFHANITYIDDKRAWLLGKPITKTWAMVLFGNFYHPTCFVRKAVYQQHGNFKLNFPIASDYDLGVRFWKAGVEFQHIDQNFAYFRLGGLSSNLYQNQWERHLIRLENNENPAYSLGILMLVIVNYYKNRLRESIAKIFREP
jgi:glycosyltransferase involved in cell wall biosynthesis